MREEHMKQVERWAHFVRDNPKDWQKHHTRFINSIFQNHKEFFRRLASTPGGKEKIVKLRQLREKSL